MRKILGFLLLVFLCLLLSRCGGGSSSTTPAPKPTVLSFAFLRSTSSNLFQPIIGKLTNGVYSETGINTQVDIHSVILSPDGKLGLFDMTNDKGAMDIYIANADGTGQPTALTNDDFDDMYPVFSPDGKTIAFMSNQGNANGWDIMVANPDGTGQINLTANLGVDFGQPSFSPDGKTIVASGYDNNNSFSNIYFMGSDGTSPTPITLNTDLGVQCWWPAYMPDGRIAFTRIDANTMTMDIYVMNKDGNNLQKLSTSGMDWYPRALGNLIVFNSYRDGNAEIYTMKPDGSSVTRLTNNSVYDSFSSDFYLGTHSAARRWTKGF